MNQALGQLATVFGAIHAVRAHAKVQEGSEFFGIGDAIGELALNRDGLEIDRALLKSEGNIGTCQGNRDDGCCRSVVEERKT